MRRVSRVRVPSRPKVFLFFFCLFSFLFFFLFFFRSFVAVLYMRPLGPLGSSLPLRLLSHRSSTTTTTAATTRSAPSDAGSGPSLRSPRSPRGSSTPFFFSHLASLFSLVALSLSPLGAFLLFRARRHRGPPQKRRSIVALSRL
jgi:hypothetical protein